MQEFSRLQEAVEAVAEGRVVIVVDSEEREDEGDFVCAAEKVTPEIVHFMIFHGRGQLCVPILSETAERLKLSQMVESADISTPRFTIPIDHSYCKTGISPVERAFTIRSIIDPSSRPEEFVQPGHVFPLIAQPNGVLCRPGHTEATVDLVRLAGLQGSGVLCEICSRDGRHMAGAAELQELACEFDLPIVTIDELIEFRSRHDGDFEELTLAPGNKTAEQRC